MSMLKIEKYSKREADTNPTSIASLLITIDNLKSGESITITKLWKDYVMFAAKTNQEQLNINHKV